MFKVTNKNTRTTSSDVLIVNFEHISHFFLMFLLFIRTSKCELYTALQFVLNSNCRLKFYLIGSLKQRRAFNPLSANPTKWSNTLKQFVAKLPTNCLSVFDHFVGLALKGLKSSRTQRTTSTQCNPEASTRGFL